MATSNNIARLREAKGWSRPELAELMGTSPQQVEKLEKGLRTLREAWIRKAADALGVSPAEILGDGGSGNAVPFKFEGASAVELRRDLPIFGTALGAPRLVEGEAIEQTTLNQGEVVDYVLRPTMLNHRSDVYGLYVVGSSMAPVYSEGGTVFAETKRPPSIGDDVVVYLRDENDFGEVRARCVLLKRLVRRTSDFIELEQFNPPIVFQIPMSEIYRYDRVLTLGDILS